MVHGLLKTQKWLGGVVYCFVQYRCVKAAMLVERQRWV